MKLARRIERLEAGLGAALVVGMWLHDADGRPTRHRLSSQGFKLEHWLQTGELPAQVDFLMVMAFEDDGTKEEGWTPFPEEMHPETLRQFEKMRQVEAYNFIDGVFRDLGGVAREQHQDLYPDA